MSSFGAEGRGVVSPSKKKALPIADYCLSETEGINYQLLRDPLSSSVYGHSIDDTSDGMSTTAGSSSGGGGVDGGICFSSDMGAYALDLDDSVFDLLDAELAAAAAADKTHMTNKKTSNKSRRKKRDVNKKSSATPPSEKEDSTCNCLATSNIPPTNTTTDGAGQHPDFQTEGMGKELDPRSCKPADSQDSGQKQIRKVRKDPIVYAEDIPDYRGKEEIEDLLNFIGKGPNNDGLSKDKKKKGKKKGLPTVGRQCRSSVESKDEKTDLSDPESESVVDPSYSLAKSSSLPLDNNNKVCCKCNGSKNNSSSTTTTTTINNKNSNKINNHPNNKSQSSSTPVVAVDKNGLGSGGGGGGHGGSNTRGQSAADSNGMVLNPENSSPTSAEPFILVEKKSKKRLNAHLSLNMNHRPSANKFAPKSPYRSSRKLGSTVIHPHQNNHDPQHNHHHHHDPPHHTHQTYHHHHHHCDEKAEIDSSSASSSYPDLEGGSGPGPTPSPPSPTSSTPSSASYCKARRNSTGNVHMQMCRTVQSVTTEDSDNESWTSLPISQGTQLIDNSYPISYAKIAALSLSSSANSQSSSTRSSKASTAVDNGPGVSNSGIKEVSAAIAGGDTGGGNVGVVKINSVATMTGKDNHHQHQPRRRSSSSTNNGNEQSCCGSDASGTENGDNNNNNSGSSKNSNHNHHHTINNDTDTIDDNNNNNANKYLFEKDNECLHGKQRRRHSVGEGCTSADGTVASSAKDTKVSGHACPNTTTTTTAHTTATTAANPKSGSLSDKVHKKDPAGQKLDPKEQQQQGISFCDPKTSSIYKNIVSGLRHDSASSPPSSLPLQLSSSSCSSSAAMTNVNGDDNCNNKAKNFNKSSSSSNKSVVAAAVSHNNPSSSPLLLAQQQPCNIYVNDNNNDKNNDKNKKNDHLYTNSSSSNSNNNGGGDDVIIDDVYGGNEKINGDDPLSTMSLAVGADMLAVKFINPRDKKHNDKQYKITFGFFYDPENKNAASGSNNPPLPQHGHNHHRRHRHHHHRRRRSSSSSSSSSNGVGNGGGVCPSELPASSSSLSPVDPATVFLPRRRHQRPSSSGTATTGGKDNGNDENRHKKSGDNKKNGGGSKQSSPQSSSSISSPQSSSSSSSSSFSVSSLSASAVSKTTIPGDSVVPAPRAGHLPEQEKKKASISAAAANATPVKATPTEAVKCMSKLNGVALPNGGKSSIACEDSPCFSSTRASATEASAGNSSNTTATARGNSCKAATPAVAGGAAAIHDDHSKSRDLSNNIQGAKNGNHQHQQNNQHHLHPHSQQQPSNNNKKTMPHNAKYGRNNNNSNRDSTTTSGGASVRSLQDSLQLIALSYGDKIQKDSAHKVIHYQSDVADTQFFNQQEILSYLSNEYHRVCHLSGPSAIVRVGTD
ncbi:rho GTPase-activating protein gacU-like isoform X1 [Argonauta hians]